MEYSIPLFRRPTLRVLLLLLLNQNPQQTLSLSYLAPHRLDPLRQNRERAMSIAREFELLGYSVDVSNPADDLVGRLIKQISTVPRPDG